MLKLRAFIVVCMAGHGKHLPLLHRNIGAKPLVVASNKICLISNFRRLLKNF